MVDARGGKRSAGVAALRAQRVVIWSWSSMMGTGLTKSAALAVASGELHLLHVSKAGNHGAAQRWQPVSDRTPPSHARTFRVPWPRMSPIWPTSCAFRDGTADAGAGSIPAANRLPCGDVVGDTLLEVGNIRLEEASYPRPAAHGSPGDGRLVTVGRPFGRCERVPPAGTAKASTHPSASRTRTYSSATSNQEGRA